MKDSSHTLSGFDSFDISLGDQLRGERATLGKSLIDVQRELRIKAVYIAAIEDADLSVFPNHGFVAGYVRSYARYLNMDADSVFERFCAESGFEGVNADISGAKRSKSPQIRPLAGALSHDTLGRGRIASSTMSGVDMSSSLAGLGSLAVIGALVLGIGYGGWAVLQEVQRVELAPIAPSRIVTNSSAQGFPSIGGFEETSLPVTDRVASLEALYGSTNLPESPPILFEPRDGPIGVIDPDSVGTFAPVRDTADLPPAPALPHEADLGPLIAAPAIPDVAIIATDPAWVRVTLDDGSAILEKILAAGEFFTIPDGVEAPVLRAGNAGAVYLRVGEDVYGPLGTGARVVKDVALTAEAIPTAWPTATTRPDLSQAVEESLAAAAAAN